MDKIRVDLEEIRDIQDRRRAINRWNIQHIEFFENGKKIEISEEAIEHFKFTGLSNIDFITTEMYKGDQK